LFKRFDAPNLDILVDFDVKTLWNLMRKNVIESTRPFKSFESRRSGQRKASQSIEESGDPGLTRTVRSIHGTTQSELIRTAGSDSTKLISTQEILQSDPLVVVRESDSASSILVNRIFRSGTIVSTRPDGSRTESKLNGLTFEASNLCQPVSGSLTGTYTPSPSKDNDKPLTYRIDFREGGAFLIIDGEDNNALAEEELPVSFCEEK
jgi:hypothetical protein